MFRGVDESTWPRLHVLSIPCPAPKACRQTDQNGSGIPHLSGGSECSCEVGPDGNKKKKSKNLGGRKNRDGERFLCQ
ncbi:hypothetical protein JZ751_012027 [Albula glossodonta]|uniref:Uncharacterized protein n=1 Tax=Albula glossodonta TaxID=121402 RepID=A0A8T2PRB5_9TELE|nr:hypothetical protein JZ751_012027 [Albula glossodonta]